jgi:hypothetical protein
MTNTHFLCEHLLKTRDLMTDRDKWEDECIFEKYDPRWGPIAGFCKHD